MIKIFRKKCKEFKEVSKEEIKEAKRQADTYKEGEESENNN